MTPEEKIIKKRERQKRFYEKHKEQVNLKNTLYRKNNREKINAQQRNRRNEHKSIKDDKGI